MAYATDTAAVGNSLGQRFAEFRASVADRMEKNRIFRTTLSELENLSDRDLADMGISRGAIHDIATQAAYGN
jgi:uncharacterized protein YjiS (DUF1127 family)